MQSIFSGIIIIIIVRWLTINYDYHFLSSVRFCAYIQDNRFSRLNKYRTSQSDVLYINTRHIVCLCVGLFTGLPAEDPDGEVRGLQ